MTYKTENLFKEEDYISWDDKFLVGIPKIDAEHKKLVSICNHLYKVIRSSAASRRKEAVRSALQECSNYVLKHFADEEKLMAACGYPDLENHKKIHAGFGMKILEKVNDFENETLASSLDFVKYLYDWVLSHIAHTDTLYLDDLKKYLANH